MPTPRSDEEVKRLSEIYKVTELAIRFNDDIRMSGFDFEKLLKAGADVNAPTLTGNTPLHTAADVDNRYIAKKLLELRAKVDARNELGQTPLHLAAGKPHPAMAALLLDNGADVNAADINGVTPLHIAANYSTLATVDLLLSRGADPGAKTTDRFGVTPLHIAGRVGNREKAAHMIVKRPEAAQITDDEGNLPQVFEGDEGMEDIQWLVGYLARTAAPPAAAQRRMPAEAARLRRQGIFPTTPPTPGQIARAAVERERANDAAAAAARAEAAGKKYVRDDEFIKRAGRRRGRKTVKVRKALKKKTAKRRR